jgi:predicted esterase YcpF (UPF0227 family)
MKLLYYFNGFNSAIPEQIEPGSKLDEVRSFCTREGYELRPITIDYRHTAEHREEILAELPDDVDEVVFCGTSMGGWFSRILQVSVQRPGLRAVALAFNPVAHLENMRRHEGPQLNFVTGERYHWGPEDTGRILALQASVDYEASLPFWVFCDKGDELIDWRDSCARYKPIARFHAFEGGEHRFAHAREALEIFSQARHDISAEQVFGL